jgi:carboxyl-terminal processing protease
MSQTNLRIPIITIILLIGIIIGTQLEWLLPSDQLKESENKLNEVLRYTSKYYVDEISYDDLVEAAINGMFEKLDPHTSYISIRDQKLSIEQFRGNFEGIGVEFQIIKDTITVVSPISGGPSEALGILSGDRIVKINNEDCIGFENNEVINSLRGEKGTTVVVEIYRPGNTELLKFEIERDEIPIYSLDASFMANDSTGYLSISRFAETTYSELINALDELRENGMRNIILDLRNNPGGLMRQAELISDVFIDSSKLIVYTKGRISEFDDEFFAERNYPFEQMPLVVLINRGSASASEIVAGAVQDWDRGLLIGETTFGKGLVQRPFILDDNSAVRITVSKYYTPLGRQIQRSYENGKDEYYEELMTRRDSINDLDIDSTNQIFITPSGRKLVSDGGINPDISIAASKLTPLSINLQRQNLYYLFIRNYLDHSSKNYNKLYSNSLQRFSAEFKFNKSDETRFIEYIKQNKIEFNESDYNKDKAYIYSRLKAYIAREYWKNDGWFYILLQNDDIFQAAIKNIYQAKLMLN